MDGVVAVVGVGRALHTTISRTETDTSSYGFVKTTLMLIVNSAIRRLIENLDVMVMATFSEFRGDMYAKGGRWASYLCGYLLTARAVQQHILKSAALGL